MEQNRVLTMQEAAEYLKTTRQTIFKMIKSGKLRGNKIGRGYRFLQEDLDKLIRGEPEDLKAASR
jgi:excisionase family DNA binding protein